jgi:hypothetical protein
MAGIATRATRIHITAMVPKQLPSATGEICGDAPLGSAAVSGEVWFQTRSKNSLPQFGERSTRP